jgi:shikimate kinase
MQAKQVIALVGLSGTGKSSVGRRLAERLGWPLVDTDMLIERNAGRTIPQIFAEDGEPGFRELEAVALQEALAHAPAVVATGGGIVLREQNRALLRAHARVVWLDASTATLIARLAAHGEARPLLQGADPAARLEALRQSRAAIYAEVAHLRIATDQATGAEIIEEIVGALEL